MANHYRYKVWCETEADWAEYEGVWYEEGVFPTLCPNDPAHTIDLTKLVAVEMCADVDVNITNMATMDSPDKSVQRVAVQPGRTGYYMCDRDIKVNTAIFTNALSFEDKRKDAADNKRKDWGETTQVGCFKGNDVDGYTLCTSQPDADANATQSIWDFQARDPQVPGNLIDVDIKGGCFWVDPNLTGDLWEHQLYAQIEPSFHTPSAGVPFFDAYLYPNAGTWIQAINCLAVPLNPAPYPPLSKIRMWVHYPPGAKQTHNIRLLLFRNKFHL